MFQGIGSIEDAIYLLFTISLMWLTAGQSCSHRNYASAFGAKLGSASQEVLEPKTVLNETNTSFYTWIMWGWVKTYDSLT